MSASNTPRGLTPQIDFTDWRATVNGTRNPSDPAAESWRRIPGFPDYEVSDAGNVRSWKTGQPRPIKLTPDMQGYMGFRPCIAGVAYPRLIHSVVLLAFVGPRPAGMEARHYDGNPTNNSLGNLSWATHVANCSDRRRHGTERKPQRMTMSATCGNGHIRTDENTAVTPRGYPTCRVCSRASQRASRPTTLAGRQQKVNESRASNA